LVGGDAEADDGPSALKVEGENDVRREDLEVAEEFLKARLREDEAAARALRPGKNEGVAKLRDRVLADVEAKWRLLDWVHEPQRELKESERSPVGRAIINGWVRRRRPVIYELVAAYAGHPDFRPEWSPIEDEEPRQATSG
jgi:hypothetical protein